MSAIGHLKLGMSAIGHSDENECRRSDIFFILIRNVGNQTFSVEGSVESSVEGYGLRLSLPTGKGVSYKTVNFKTVNFLANFGAGKNDPKIHRRRRL